MTTEAAARTCPTCGQECQPGEFYANSTECKPCKRQRSQRNRVAAMQKVVLADRLVDALQRLADQGWQPEALLASSPSSSIEPQEVRP